MKQKGVIAIVFLFCAGHIFAQTGKIVELAGKVEIKKPGALNFIEAKIGNEITSDTIISTGLRSFALVALGSTQLTIRPLTLLTLKEISSTAETETLNVNLQTGRVRVTVNPPAGARASMSVSSPMATASVRGTVFEFNTQELLVLEGAVYFQGANGKVKMIRAVNTSEIIDDGIAADPIDMLVFKLNLPPLAGTNSGYNHGGVTVSSDGNGSFNFIYDLR